MIVKSTNIAQPRTIEWNGKQHLTGIYKTCLEAGIVLESEDVRDDHVLDRRYHGGIDKACYLYSADHYSFWKEKYPNMEWQCGMFGENLTIAGLDESSIRIGNEYQIGEAVVQVSQPRQPCFKLGVRFGNQQVVHDFWLENYPGVYVRILKAGLVKSGDEMRLIKENTEGMSVAEVFSLFSSNRKNESLLQKAIQQKYLAESCRLDLEKIQNLRNYINQN